MLNHALFGGLLYAQAIPFIDDYFHKNLLNIKINSMINSPELKSVLEDTQRMRRIKSDMLALTTLRDIDIPIIPIKLPLKTL